MAISDETSLLIEVVGIYDRLQMEDVFQIPSSQVKVHYHTMFHSKNRGAIHSIRRDYLILDIYAINVQEGIKVAAALLAHTRLNIARPFGARLGALLYMLPILHLLITLLVEAIGPLFLGFKFGIVFGIGAAVTMLLLIFWVSASFETRRTILKENLDATNQFKNSIEIDEVVVWLEIKGHSRRFWIKRLFYYEAFYIPIILLMIFLNSL